MNARAFATVLVLLGLTGMMGQGGGLPADSPPRGGPPQDAAAGGDRTQRIRELIYVFRNYRVFSRDEEWAQTIRELATIGKDAVPELVAELDRTDRDATLRSLGFCLRAIGDPRAVPALIRAIPKTLRPPGSDCGVIIVDPDLRAFMRAHQNARDDQGKHVASGRPVNEIFSALEKITGHREFPEIGAKETDTLRLVFLDGTPEQQARQRALFEERRKRWEAWWSEHRREFVTEEERRSVELPKREEDLVEKAGIARYGMLFPTGPHVRLGPVRMLRLSRLFYANARSHLDLDTGRVFMQYEGLKAVDWRKPDDEFGSRAHAWYRQNGIDVYCHGLVEGFDLQLWLIDNSRWDTLEAEVQTGEPLRLGPEETSYLVRPGESRNDRKPNETATFLLTTRDGGRGIIQVFPRDVDADRYRVRYRMWSTAQAAPAAAEPRKVKAPGTSFGDVVTTTLERAAEKRACLMDLETGRKVVPPEILKPHEIAEATSLPRNDQFARWCRDQGIDLFVATMRVLGAEAGPQPRSALIGLDMVQARVVPLTFDEYTVEETRELLERMPKPRSSSVWMTIDGNLAERPDTFAFRTREGTVGLLQLEMAGKGAEALTIRYRLERRD